MIRRNALGVLFKDDKRFFENRRIKYKVKLILSYISIKRGAIYSLFFV